MATVGVKGLIDWLSGICVWFQWLWLVWLVLAHFVL